MRHVAVWGATGYAGQELIRLLSMHPQVRVVRAFSRNPQPPLLQAQLPNLQTALKLEPLPMTAADPDDDELPDLSDIDVLFCALPHGKSARVVAAALAAGCRVIDLGADYRLKQPSLYEAWYQFSHPAPQLLEQAVYGLPEFAEPLHGGDPWRDARLVAAPGCYPTGALLALLPLLAHDLIETGGIIIDSKSGASGAGRTPGEALTFSEITENVYAYKVGEHRHTPEIEQAVRIVSGDDDAVVSFTPHLVPMARGILTTCYATLKPGTGADDVRDAFASSYRDAPFVHLLPDGMQPRTKWVRGSNAAMIQWRVDARSGRVVVTSAIDNLVKGAAGQAVQCMNLMFDWPETTGLESGGLTP